MLAAVGPLGGQEGSENPSKEETVCMEKEVCVEEGRREGWKLKKGTTKQGESY